MLGPRPTIRIERVMRVNVERAIAVLVDRAAIYQHDGNLFDVIRTDLRGEFDFRLRKLSAGRLTLHLDRIAKWEKFDLSSERWFPCDVPTKLGHAILSRDYGEWPFPYVKGIEPRLWPDGSLLPNVRPATEVSRCRD
jgi:hypothetical protein